LTWSHGFSNMFLNTDWSRHSCGGC